MEGAPRFISLYIANVIRITTILQKARIDESTSEMIRDDIDVLKRMVRPYTEVLRQALSALFYGFVGAGIEGMLDYIEPIDTEITLNYIIHAGAIPPDLAVNLESIAALKAALVREGSYMKTILSELPKSSKKKWSNKRTLKTDNRGFTGVTRRL